MKRSSCCHKRRQARRRQRQLDHDRAHLVGRHLPALLVDDAHVVARHRHAGRAVLDRRLEPDRIAADRPAGLGLPPVVDHRLLEQLLAQITVSGSARSPARTACGISTGPSAGEEFSLRVLFLDGAERGRRREHGDAAVLGDHPPERAGVGRPPACPRRGSRCSRGTAARRRCSCGRPPSRRRRPTTSTRLARRRRDASSTI